MLRTLAAGFAVAAALMGTGAGAAMAVEQDAPSVSAFPADFTGTSIRIHDAAAYDAPTIGWGNPGDGFDVHCQVQDSTTLPVVTYWYYGTNRATGVTGFAHSSWVTKGVAVAAC